MGELHRLCREVTRLCGSFYKTKNRFLLLVRMVGKGCEGDWEYKTPKAPVPVKLTVKKMVGTDWMVACMVPRGNMMHCMLKEEEGRLKQIKFNITGKEPPVEILEVECIMADFFEAGITNMVREGEILKVYSGENQKEMVFALDKNN